MAKGKAVIRYGGDGFYIGVSPGGHALVLDTDSERAAALTPIELLLLAVGGCMGSDIVDILGKRRETVTGYHVEVQGERRNDSPRSFREITLHHVIRGVSVSPESVSQAIELSSSKYCSVAATFRPTVEIKTSFEVIEESQAHEE